MNSKELKNLMESYASIYDIEEQKNKNGGASKDKEMKFHSKLDKLVHKTFGKSPEEQKEEVEIEETSYSAKAARSGKDIGKPGKQFAKIAKEAGKRYGSKERGEKVAGAVLAKLRKEDVDIFDIVLEYLVVEGYADTNESAIAIMSNMSEEWKQSILEARAMSHTGGQPHPLQGSGGKPKGITGGVSFTIDDLVKEKKKKEK